MRLDYEEADALHAARLLLKILDTSEMQERIRRKQEDARGVIEVEFTVVDPADEDSPLPALPMPTDAA